MTSATVPFGTVGIRPTPPRVGCLDGLRTIGIVLVLLFHARVPRSSAGRFGVDVFFPLSGFLITGILVREFMRTGDLSLRRFYLRRATRLYPALGVAVVLALVTNGAPHWFGDAGLAVTYTMNLAVSWAHHPATRPLTPTWSLALEEQFYLLWPLLLWALLRCGASLRVIGLVAVGATALSWRVLVVTSNSYFRPDARVGGLMIGCAGALLTHNRQFQAATAERLLMVAGGVLFCALCIPTAFEQTHATDAVGIPLTSLATAIALPALLALPDSIAARALGQRTMVWVGRRSYGVYLVHYPIIYALHKGGWTPISIVAIALPASFALAALLYRLVEMPVLAWRDRQSLMAG